MSNSDKVLRYLETIAPERASNAEISHQLRIKPHQQVFQITQNLRKQRLIRGSKLGKEWSFWVEKKLQKRISRQVSKPENKLPVRRKSKLTPAEFERLARTVMEQHFDVELKERVVGKVHKKFDFVSSDKKVVGDAKYYKMVRDVNLPPAKFSVIAEHVWLLEKTTAEMQFLVFGNDRRVLKQWLKRYGSLCSGTQFYFLNKNGELERLM